MLRHLPSLRHVRWRGDLFAGLTLAAIAIPEQMATARLAGFPPHVGFIAFIVGSLAFALLGSSRVVSVGADSTIAPIFAGALGLVAATGSPHYHALASLLALLVGAILIIASMLRAGAIADLLSIPVLTGFLAGVAIHIALSQTPAFLGLAPGPEAPLPRLVSLVRDIGKANAPTILIGASCLSLIFLTEKLNPRIPGALIALAAAAWATTNFNLTARGVAVLGNIAHASPRLALPAFSVGDLTHIVGLAVIISLVVMVQTAATSRAFPTQDAAPNVDQDFLGAGAGSVLAGLFGAFAVDASPPRTAIVVESGGASQLSGLAAAAIVAATLFYGGALLAQIPTAALAAVLIFVAGRLLRWRDMLSIFRATRAEFMLVVLTMLAVVLLPIQTGVGLAIILSLLHGVWTTTRTHLVEMEHIPGTTVWWPVSEAFVGERVPGLLVVAFQAPLSFLNADLFRRGLTAALDRTDPGIRFVVLEASSLVEIDYSAALALRQAIETCRSRGIDFAVARLESLRAQEAFERFGVAQALGDRHLFHSVDEAVRALMGPPSESGGLDAPAL
jgi:sulfate permease, SulP family